MKRIEYLSDAMNSQIYPLTGKRNIRSSAAFFCLAFGAAYSLSAQTVQPWLEEDFSTYASTAQMLADPRGIYSVAEDFEPSQITLDKTIGCGTLTQSMRYDYPDRTGDQANRCHDYTIGRNIRLPGSVPEIWLEVVAMFQNGFHTAAPTAWGCTSNPDYKFIFGRVSPSSRFELTVGGYTGESGVSIGYPGNESAGGGSWPPSGIFDGQWHTYRFHWKAGNNGICTMWRDGLMEETFQNVATTASSIYGIALSRNMNQGPAALESMWYGRVRVWNTDPQFGSSSVQVGPTGVLPRFEVTVGSVAANKILFPAMLPNNGNLSFRVCDIAGREIWNCREPNVKAGLCKIVWNWGESRIVPANGQYFVLATGNNNEVTKNFVIMKK